MAKYIIGKGVAKSCDHCFYGRKSSAFDIILCKFKGPVGAENHCRKYKYDPLKREPENQLVMPEYSKEDFEL